MSENNDFFLDELVRAGLLDDAQAQEITEEHVRTGKPSRVLVQEAGLATEDQVLDVVCQLLGAERVDLEHMMVNPDVLAAVPGNIARMYTAMPIAMCTCFQRFSFSALMISLSRSKRRISSSRLLKSSFRSMTANSSPPILNTGLWWNMRQISWQAVFRYTSPLSWPY